MNKIESLVGQLNQVTDSANALKSELEMKSAYLDDDYRQKVAFAVSELNRCLQRILLPARGPSNSTTHQCPHCEEEIEIDITVSVS